MDEARLLGGFQTYFGELTDPRIERSKVYPLEEIEGLCEKPWVRELELAAQEIDHIDEVSDVSKSARTTFGKLNFAVDALEYCVTRRRE
jgi:hypothetical protein